MNKSLLYNSNKEIDRMKPIYRFRSSVTKQSSSYLTVWVGRRAGILPAAGCSSARRPPLKNENDRYNSNSASSGTFQLPWSVCCKRGVLLRIRETSVGLPEVQNLHFRVPLSPVVMRKIQWTGNLRRTTSWNPLCGLKCRFATLQGHKTVQVNVIPSKLG